MQAVLSYLTLSGRPSCIKEQDYRRYAIIMTVAILALLIHLVLIFVFWHIGATNLSWLNVGSVTIWSVGLYLNFHGRHDRAIILLCLEVIVHSWVVCSTLGLQTGFHHYLWAISPLPILNSRMNLLWASVFSIAVIFVFALMYHVYGALPYRFRYAEWLPTVHFSNVLISGSAFIFVLGFIRNITLNQEQYLQDLASKDSLTQQFNRRAMINAATQVFAQAARSEEPVCIAMVDLDHFKTINDNYGHAEGDRVLQQVAALIKSRLRKSDIVSRWGGEEFLVLLPDTSGDQAKVLLEAIRQKVSESHTHPDYRVTVSVGVVECYGVTDFNDAVHCADQAMYLSKVNGRNCVTRLDCGPATND